MPIRSSTANHPYPENLIQAIGLDNLYFEKNIHQILDQYPLTPTEKQIIDFRYKQQMTLRKTAAEIHISIERVRQLESGLLQNLREC